MATIPPISRLNRSRVAIRAAIVVYERMVNRPVEADEQVPEACHVRHVLGESHGDNLAFVETAKDGGIVLSKTQVQPGNKVIADVETAFRGGLESAFDDRSSVDIIKYVSLDNAAFSRNLSRSTCSRRSCVSNRSLSTAMGAPLSCCSKALRTSRMSCAASGKQVNTDS